MDLLILVGEGRELPTSFIKHCSENPTFDERTMAYYNETIETSVKRIQPLISYFHKDQDRISLEELTNRRSTIYGNCNPEFTW